jgi:hypothetical protein
LAGDGTAGENESSVIEAAYEEGVLRTAGGKRPGNIMLSLLVSSSFLFA